MAETATRGKIRWGADYVVEAISVTAALRPKGERR
jgi:hypothetical protein